MFGLASAGLAEGADYAKAKTHLPLLYFVKHNKHLLEHTKLNSLQDRHYTGNVMLDAHLWCLILCFKVQYNFIPTTMATATTSLGKASRVGKIYPQHVEVKGPVYGQY